MSATINYTRTKSKKKATTAQVPTTKSKMNFDPVHRTPHSSGYEIP